MKNKYHLIGPRLSHPANINAWNVVAYIQTTLSTPPSCLVTQYLCWCVVLEVPIIEAKGAKEVDYLLMMRKRCGAPAMVRLGSYTNPL